MLPSELLFSSKRGSQVYPRFLKREQHLWAEQVLDLIHQYQPVSYTHLTLPTNREV